MKTSLRWFVALALVVWVAIASLAAAQDSAPTVIDSGRYMVLNHGRTMAFESFEFALVSDSVVISSAIRRVVPGTTEPDTAILKQMALVADAFDFGLRSYTSNYALDGHTVVKGVIPGDTAMTVYTEYDGAGTADRIAQPPGRIFIMDPMMFTLFGVVCHNLNGKTFTKRPLQLLTLGETPSGAEITVENGGADTLMWGARRTVTRKLSLRDPAGVFTVWMNANGEMLKMEHAASGLTVLREAPAPAPKKPAAVLPKKKPAARR